MRSVDSHLPRLTWLLPPLNVHPTNHSQAEPPRWHVFQEKKLPPGGELTH